MTLPEFLAWLEGFEASFSGAPNADQYAKIKAKMATVDAPSRPTPSQEMRDWLKSNPYRPGQGDQCRSVGVDIQYHPPEYVQC